MSEGSIIVAYASLHELPPVALACLSQSEIERAKKFKAPQRRLQSVCARALLRAVLERYTGNPAASHELTTDSKGKPVCVGGPAVSIAHSGDLVICAVTDTGEIGIDIEVPGRQRNTKGIADRFFARDEAAWLATQPDGRFHMLWVLKEAWLKATGLGLAGGLDSLRCFVTPPDIEAHVTDADSRLEALSLYTIDDALVGLATTIAAHKTVIIDHWDARVGRFDDNGGAQLIASTN
jgi:4'-phosphopantetheinyl transferase